MFDPYHKWLGIPAAEQPVNHYRLLGLTLFESDPDVIDAATDQRVAFLRQCATGEHVAESQKLLNEVAAARLCLLNAQKKRDYDERLRESLSVARSHSSTTDAASRIRSSPWGMAAIGGMLAVLVLLLALLNAHRDSGRGPLDDDSTKFSATPNSTDPSSPNATNGEKSAIRVNNVGIADREKPSSPDKWAHLILDQATLEDGFVRLIENEKVFTKQEYTGPIDINVTARTDRLNIRLHAYRGSVVIFNWEVKLRELRVLRPDGSSRLESGSLARANFTPLKPNTWYKLKWQIRDDGMAVFVDNQQVFAEKRNYDLSAKSRIAVSSTDSIVDVREFKVEPLLAPQTGLDERAQAIEKELVTFREADAVATKKADPIVGNWQWFDRQEVIVKEDGTFATTTGRRGYWKLMSSTSELRAYALEWDGGASVDSLLMSRDGKELGGTNQVGHKIGAKRLRPGLIALIYEGADFEKQRHARIDSVINVNFAAGPPAPGLPIDGFSVRWIGILKVPATGNYTFFLDHDDGGRLWLDDRPVIDNWRSGVSHDQAILTLREGLHPIKVEYCERGGFGGVNLWWKFGEQARAIIPQSALFHNADTAAQFGVTGTVIGEERDDNSLKMKFCWCPRGTFAMGSPKNEPSRVDDEDQVPVTLTQGVWMGKFEVTQEEWRSIMETDIRQQQALAGAKGLPGDGARFPMYFVSHDEATEFCQKLTETERREGRLPAGFVYRLPTEAEWEYACRAGTTTATAFGNNLSSTEANFNGAYPFNGAAKGPNRQTTMEVGSLPANAWGLHDLHGNVFEWCLDSVKKLPGGDDPVVRPIAKESPRIFRGGSWRQDGGYCRSADRNWNAPTFRSDDLGFRIVLGLELK